MKISLIKGAKQVVAIDIGSYAIKIVALRPDPPRINFYSIIEIPEKATEDFLCDAIQKALKEHRTAGSQVLLNISGDFVHIRRLEFPSMPQNEIKEALKWKAKDRMPFDIDRAVYDFKVVGTSQKEDGSKTVDIIFAAALKDEVDSKARLFKKMNYDLVSINLSPFALENVVSLAGLPDPSRSVMLIDVGGSKTDMSFYKDRSLQFVRTIPVSSGDITSALCGPVVIGAEKRNFPKDEAEDMKRKVGIPYDAATVTESGLASIHILTMMRGVLERFSKEVKRSIEYYTLEIGGEGVREVYLTGGGSRLKNLDKYLAEELKLPVTKLGIPKAVDASIAGLSDEDALSMMPALGAALCLSKKVNMLPYEYRSAKVEEAQKISIRLISIITAAAFLISSFAIMMRVDDYERRVKNALIHKEVLEQVRPLVQEIEEKERFIQTTDRINLEIEYIMKLISNTIPQSVVLNNMAIDQKMKTLEIAGVVRGKGVSAEATLTAFMEDLERSDLLKEAQLSSVREEPSKEGNESSFTISCQLN